MLFYSIVICLPAKMASLLLRSCMAILFRIYCQHIAALSHKSGSVRLKKQKSKLSKLYNLQNPFTTPMLTHCQTYRLDHT